MVSTVDDNNIVDPPKDGVWVKGLHLEGAGWDKKNACLVEANPMQLVCGMPTIHFKPVENKKKSGKGRFTFLFNYGYFVAQFYFSFLKCRDM